MSVLDSNISSVRILLSLLLTITMGVHPSASSQVLSHTLVIIDTGFDTSIEPIRSAVVFESCIMDWNFCPNSSPFQEGVGSATINPTNLVMNGIAHGTQMAGIALAVNPNQRLVLVRLIAYNSKGQRLPVYESTIIQAFKWVISKQVELNIGAVAMAQGHHNLRQDKDYCPKSLELENLILELTGSNVPVFFPAGNSGDKSRIDWPACIPSSFAIGAVDSKSKITTYSNYDRKLIDFYAPGSSQAILPGGQISPATGTSVSTIIAASYWMEVKNLKPELKLTDIRQIFRTTGPIVFDSKFRYGRKIDIEGARNFVKHLSSVSFSSYAMFRVVIQQISNRWLPQ